MRIVHDPLFGDHLRGIPHPESPDRVQAVADFLVRTNRWNDVVAAADASDAQITAVHSGAYLEIVKREVGALDGHAGYLSTGDTVVDSSSLTVARRAAGGAITAMEEAVHASRPVLGLLRPPGHHAESGRGMGFCIFNNAAIAAREYLRRFGGRVLVVDFDYHHGNGTQAVAGAGLSYVSTHGFPAYPGTGAFEENYERAGDAVMNIPLPPHAYGTEPFVATWQQLLPFAAARVKPNFIVVSAGFDYAAGDPVGDLGVDVPAARELALAIESVAREYCNGASIYLLEGGYGTNALAQSVGHIIDALSFPADGSVADQRAIPPPQTAMLGRLFGD